MHADQFGTTGNEFTIDFVSIGNPGNEDDLGAGRESPHPSYSGGVPYVYRMGTYEISEDAISKATASGLQNVTAGTWGPNQPAGNMLWYEAAAFVNWMNTSTGHMPAYQLNASNTAVTLWGSENAWQLGGENLFRHKDAYYFLPNEDEWCKAAYHQNDGVTANYWDFATGTAVHQVYSGTDQYDAVFSTFILRINSPAPADSAGGLSAYGTMGQTGNMGEWIETPAVGATPPYSWANAAHWKIRGGSFIYDRSFQLASQSQYFWNTTYHTGFRVASVQANNDYSTWAATFPGADLADPDADLDGDGLSNDDERIWGLDPTSASPATAIRTRPDPATRTFIYTRRDPGLTGLTYALWTSPDLKIWTEDTEAIQTPATPDANGVQSVTVLPNPELLAAPTLFLRMSASE